MVFYVSFVILVQVYAHLIFDGVARGVFFDGGPFGGTGVNGNKHKVRHAELFVGFSYGVFRIGLSRARTAIQRLDDCARRENGNFRFRSFFVRRNGERPVLARYRILVGVRRVVYVIAFCKCVETLLFRGILLQNFLGSIGEERFVQSFYRRRDFFL